MKHQAIKVNNLIGFNWKCTKCGKYASVNSCTQEEFEQQDCKVEIAPKNEAIKHFTTQNRRYVREHDGRPCKYYLAALKALENWQEEVDINYLQNWYIDSVDNTQEPVWTEKHIEELFNDFILIPKNEV